MAILKHVKRIAYIDFVIKRKATGDLETFARKNGLSKRAMTSVLQEMKELGFPIKYDRERRTYYYTEEGQMVQCLFIKNGQLLSRDEVKEIDRADNLCFSTIKVIEQCKQS